jgi:hypothetical protein
MTGSSPHPAESAPFALPALPACVTVGYALQNAISQPVRSRHRRSPARPLRSIHPVHRVLLPFAAGLPAGPAQVRGGVRHRDVGAGQGHIQFIAGQVAQGQGARRRPHQVGGLPQHRLGHPQSLPARRGVRARRRHRVRHGSGHLRTHARPAAEPAELHHLRPDLHHDPRTRTQGRIPRPRRADDSPRHRRGEAPAAHARHDRRPERLTGRCGVRGGGRHRRRLRERLLHRGPARTGLRGG